MNRLKIRLADWRDRESIQPLRRMLKRPVDGGLYELLNWPMYHAHIAMLDNQAVGFTAVTIHLNGIADDVGTVVAPEFRHQGIGSELRATQVRDLILMGLTHLYVAAPIDSTEAVKWCTDSIGRPLGTIDSAYLSPHIYFGNSLDVIKTNLQRMNTKEPFPLSEMNVDRLMHKLQRAMKETAQIQALGDFNIRKALIRQED